MRLSFFDLTPPASQDFDDFCISSSYYDQGFRRPAAPWFSQVREGDTPATNLLARLAVDWCDEVLRGTSEACPSSQKEEEAMELAEFLEELQKTQAVGYRAYLHPNGEIWLISPEGHFHSPLTAVCAVKTGDEYGAGWTALSR